MRSPCDDYSSISPVYERELTFDDIALLRNSFFSFALVCSPTFRIDSANLSPSYISMFDRLSRNVDRVSDFSVYRRYTQIRTIGIGYMHKRIRR